MESKKADMDLASPEDIARAHYECLPVDVVRDRSASQSSVEYGVVLDRVGITSSMLCAIHCAFLPLLITLAPTIGVSFFASHNFEWGLFAFTALLGGTSIHFGRRRHSSAWPLCVLVLGLVLIAAGLVGHEMPLRWLSVLSLVAGGVFVSAAHLLNKKLCDRCPRCRSHEA